MGFWRDLLRARLKHELSRSQRKRVGLATALQVQKLAKMLDDPAVIAALADAIQTNDALSDLLVEVKEVVRLAKRVL